MIRRIAIAAAVACVLVTAVYIYNVFAGEDGLLAGRDDHQAGQARSGARADRTVSVEKWRAERRDREGRLVGLYEADESRKLSETSWELTRPRIILYLRKGQRVYLYADKGMLHSADIGVGPKPRRGVLKGRVRVFFDRSGDPTRPAGDAPSSDLVRIYGNEVEFDSEDLAIRMGGEVAVLSAEADVFGSDLSITWHEAPQTELKRFSLAHGRCMIIYAGEEILAESTGSAPTRPGRPAGSPAAASPAVYFPRVNAGLAGLVRTAAPGPKATEAPKAPQGRNVYLATFNDNVSVFSGPRNLRYARTLTLKFEWDRDIQGLPGEKRKKAPTTAPGRGGRRLTPAGPARSRPADAAGTYAYYRTGRFSGPVVPLAVSNANRSSPRPLRLNLFEGCMEQRGASPVGEYAMDASPCYFMPLSGVVQGSSFLGNTAYRQKPHDCVVGIPPTQSGGGGGSPASRPARASGQGEPTVIMWSGPLVVEPVGRVAKTNTKRYVVEAKGKRIIWQSESMASVCSRFTVRQRPEGDALVQTVHLAGAPEAPIRLAMAASGGGQRIRCSEITFMRDGGRADLKGPGRILMPPPDEQVEDPVLALALDALPDPPGSDRVMWGGQLAATFEDVKTPDAAGKVVRRRVITGATFTHKVELAQAGTGDYVRCDDTLQVWMAQGTGKGKGRTYPSRAKAVGNVRARQEGRDITADEMDVEFAPRDDADKASKATTAGAKGAKSLSARPVRLVAVGRVRISDTRGAEPMVASADKLVSNLVDEKAVLEGDPAEVVQGESSLRGKIIHLDRAGESLVVLGSGRLRFKTDRDLDGKTLKTPRPLVATWSKQMTFAGKKDAASFVGDVKVISGDDEITCREMDLAFEKTAPPAAKGATAPAATGGKGKGKGDAKVPELGLDKRRLKTIVCRRDVSMKRIVNDVDGRLVQRMRLTGPHLTYDAGGAKKDSRTAKMIVSGPGTMSMEDYKPPEAKLAGGEVKAPAMPSQSVFVWKRGMAFSQTDRQIVLHGGVTMVNRTGNRIVLADRLNVARLGKLPPGRNVRLSCDKMTATFGDSKPAEPAKAVEATNAVALGQLRHFRAVGDVDLAEGKRRMLGEVLTYDRIKEIVVIQGTKAIPATLMYEPPDGATLKTVRSVRIECFLKDNKIVRVKTDRITTGG